MASPPALAGALGTLLLLSASGPATEGTPTSVRAAGESTPNSRADRATPAERFGWPVTPHVVVRRFVRPASRWGPGHRGVDLRTTPGAEVHAPAAGVVTFSGVIAGRGVMSVRHPQGFSTTYEPVSQRLSAGISVRRGQVLAHLDAGHCPHATCLHWGYRVGKENYRDPLTLVRGSRPILLRVRGEP